MVKNELTLKMTTENWDREPREECTRALLVPRATEVGSAQCSSRCGWAASVMGEGGAGTDGLGLGFIYCMVGFIWFRKLFHLLIYLFYSSRRIGDAEARKFGIYLEA
jgi:hypothetical protein